jgi:CBS domain-containing protein
MLENDCGEIPIVDNSDRLLGVITDRDIVCRIVAQGKNPAAHTVASCMSSPVRTINVDAPVDEVIALMQKNQIRRVPVVDEDGCCTGIIAQADLVAVGLPRQTAELLSQISRHTGWESA